MYSSATYVWRNPRQISKETDSSSAYFYHLRHSLSHSHSSFPYWLTPLSFYFRSSHDPSIARSNFECLEFEGRRWRLFRVSRGFTAEPEENWMEAQCEWSKTWNSYLIKLLQSVCIIVQRIIFISTYPANWYSSPCLLKRGTYRKPNSKETMF